MKAMLIKDGLWGYVNGKINRPAPNPQDPENGQSLIEGWEAEDEKALADIVLSVSPSELSHIEKLETSRKAWLKLESIYHSSGPARKALLLQKIVLRKMNEEDDLRTYSSEYFDIVDNLSEIVISINEDLLSILLLHSLPQSFEVFKRAIVTRDDILKPEILKIKIMEDYDSRINLNCDQQVDTEAMFAKNMRKYN